MTLQRLQEIFTNETITPDTTVGEMIDLADGLSLEDSNLVECLVEWDEVDAWLEGIGRSALYASIEHYLTAV